VVIMLVDALRADFIWQTGSRFAFVNDRIAAGEALPFTTRAHSPTVTLPRITWRLSSNVSPPPCASLPPNDPFIPRLFHRLDSFAFWPG
jgi:hypothetical protein